MLAKLIFFQLLIMVVVGLSTGCQTTDVPVAVPVTEPQTESKMEAPAEQLADLTATPKPATVVSEIEQSEALAPPTAHSVAITTTDHLAAAPLTVTVSISNVPTEVTEELIAAGREVYLKQYCGICHQLDSLETRGTFGPTHNDMAQLAAERLQDPNYQGQAETIAEYLMESLVDPKIHIMPEYVLTSHPMPEYTFLSEADLQALVALLLQQ